MKSVLWNPSIWTIFKVSAPAKLLAVTARVRGSRRSAVIAPHDIQLLFSVTSEAFPVGCVYVWPTSFLFRLASRCCGVPLLSQAEFRSGHALCSRRGGRRGASGSRKSGAMLVSGNG